MTIKKIWGSRVQADGATFIAEDGMLFYDETDGELRLGDGVTPGGTAISVRADLIVAQRLTPEADNNNAYGLGDETHRWWDLHIGDGGIHYNGFSNPQTAPYLPGAIITSLVPAYTTANLDLGSNTNRWGNVYIGPHSIHLQDQTSMADIEMTVRSGTLYLNGAQNLAVGNLTIVDTTLTSATNSLNINVGATDDTGFFYVRRKAQFDNTTFSSTEPMVSFNASGPNDPATVFPDTVIQTVSRPNKNSRIVQRSYGSSGEVGGDNAYSVWAAYSARGNIASPAAVKANDILSRLSSNGFGTTTWGSGGTRIESVALENFTDSAKGSKINFWTTPVGSIVSQQVASITATGILANSITFSTDSTTQTTAGIPLTQKGVATGVATLGVDGRLTTEQIPSSLTGAIVFQGGWNAFTNTPALSNGTGITGYQYIVTIGGDRNLGAGNVVYVSGDTVTYGANVWNRVSGSSPISSVSGNLHMQVGPTTGAVVIGINATPNATATTVVSRDASGNFQANIITAALSGQATSALTAATVTAGTQTAITAVGTLTSLAVSGNVATGNVSGTKGTFTTIAGTLLGIETDTYISALRANITAANTAISTLQTQVYANANVAAYLTTATINTTGNITAGNVIATAHYGNVVGKATQLATAGTTAAGTFLAGKLSAATGSVPKNSTATATYTITGLTTNHKIIITPGTVMPDRQFSVTAAWASAADTVSIQYANNTGGAVSVTLDINYFAFV